MAGVINVIALIYSFYFYTWLRPDLQSCVRMGLHQYKVDIIIHFGTFVWIFLAMCVLAPKFCHRTNALVGNGGMAVSSIVVIVNHWLLEQKWVWSGVLYMFNIMIYVFCLGFALMGQSSKYYYDRKRLYNLALPAAANTVVTLMCLSLFIQDTGYADVAPIISYGVHTTMAITAQVCAPRTKTWDFFEFINNRRRR